MSVKKSMGSLLPFRRDDKSPFSGQKEEKIPNKEGLITIAVILAVLIIGGIALSHFFGPHL